MNTVGHEYLSAQQLRGIFEHYQLNDGGWASACKAVGYPDMLGERAQHSVESIQNLNTAHRLLMAAESFKLDDISQCLHQDCCYRNMPLPAWTWANSRVTTMRQLRGLTAILSEYSILEYTHEYASDKAVLLDRIEILRLSGLSVKLRVVALFEFSEGLIRSWNDDFRPGDVPAGFFKSKSARRTGEHD